MGEELSAVLYEEMIENMQEGIIVINAKGNIIRMNDAAMKLLGADSSAVGVPYALLMAQNEDNDEFHEIVLNAIYHRNRLKGQIVKLAKNAEIQDEIWVSVSASYLNNEAGKAIVIVMEDLTGISELRDARIALNKIRCLNEELEAAKNEAVKANEAKSRFISNVSHEIRTPINAVLGMNEMILRESKDSDILDYAFNIQNAGKTLHFLINDILDMSKLEAGRMELTESEYELNQLLEELWGLIYLRAQENGLLLFFNIDESAPAKLYGDDIRVKQIVTNLLTNAVKYTPKGEVNLDLSYVKREEQNMIDLVIAVRDTGIGIKEEDKAAVFESFKRVDAQKNKKIEGTGLGMNITMSLLELMGGRLEMESEYQVGSTFTVVIPQKVVGDWKENVGKFDIEKKNDVNKHNNNEKPVLYAPNAEILVVDDNQMNLEVARGLLKRTGAHITTAQSGREALELIDKAEFHLILMDHQMPEMDGVETLIELRKRNSFDQKKTPVVMLTANAVAGLAQVYQDAGFDDILIKPIDPIKLEKTIERLIPDELQMEEKVELDNQTDTRNKVEEYAENLKACGIDLNNGLGHIHNDFEQYLELAKMFVSQVENTMGQLQVFMEQEDSKNYKIYVHGLKGNAATLGATELADIAKQHEDAAKNEDITFVREHFNVLLEKVNKVKMAFEEIVLGDEKQEETNAVWNDVNSWCDSLHKVCSLLEEFETDEAVLLLEKLMNEKSWICWNEELIKSLDAIKQEYDEDKAILILKTLMEGK